jgi:dephospho-CoA kinase
MIIALTGEKLAGKGTVAAYLAKQHAARVIRFSQALTDILQRLHQANTREHLVRLGGALRQQFGNDILAQVVNDDIQTAPQNFWVIDGMRYLSEYTMLAQLPNFFVVNITAPLEIRWQRTKQRQEKTDETGMSLEVFTAREQDPTEQEITLVQQRANHTLSNVGTLQELYDGLEQWLQTVGK